MSEEKQEKKASKLKLGLSGLSQKLRRTDNRAKKLKESHLARARFVLEKNQE